MMTLMRRCALLSVCCFAACLWVGVTFAQSSAPPINAEAVRQHLFDAQSALMFGNSADAQALFAEAKTRYERDLEPLIRNSQLMLAQNLSTWFATAQTALTEADLPAYAAARAQVWTALLHTSMTIVSDAIQSGDTQTATLWLPLRDYRTSTRFTRPGTDATLALSRLALGSETNEAALTAVQADLLDTYQAKFNSALQQASEANRRGFSLRRAEEASLAVGYFAILAPAYAEQRGDTALNETRLALATLNAAALAGDDASFVSALAQIDVALKGFRAAPLSDEEIVRRAGQFARFISLVPVEYARGVRNGVITNDIEIQEALTFHAGASAALADIEARLATFDPEAATQLNSLLTEVNEQIRAAAEPQTLQASIDRITQLFAATVPPEWLSGGGGADIDVILSVLDQVASSVQQGEYALAESSRIEAYALLELGLEQRLRGFAPELAVTVESLFWQGTLEHQGLAVLLAQRAPSDQIRSTLQALETSLNDAQIILGSKTEPTAVIGNAAVIVFREGLEAVLILASLLASLRTAEMLRYRRPIIAGALLAFFATALTWVVANSLLQIMLPLGERLEAIVSLIAIGVLLLITNWFFHRVYWVDWMANFHARKRNLIGGISFGIGQALGLVILGFTSIYREGFETILFLQSLVLEAGISTVLQGVALGLLGTAVVGVITFVLQVRLPYKKMLVVTGVLIGFVLLTMVGNTVHVMQAIGWLPITPMINVYLPYWMGRWFGLYATWQGIGLQFAAAAFVIGSYFLAERHTRQARSKPSQRSGSAVEQPVKAT